MGEKTGTTLIKGGRILDPAQGIDRVADVLIEDGTISAVGDGLAAPDGASVVDVDGCFVSPGWIDIHVHAFGTLGFADPDSIGIWQGTTTFVEAGGPGIGTFDEFVAQMEGRTVTDLYAGLYFRPMGIIGLNFIESELRSLMDVPIAQSLDLAKEHKDILRYFKIGAFGNYGRGPLKIGKGFAEMLGIPLYVHIGEFQETPEQLATTDIFELAERGDIITHVYHGNPGRVLDDNDKVLPEVLEATRRGVLLDVGFGGYNFSWSVAEKAFAQGLVPDILSSDLQQFNVNGPVYSFANVLSVFLHLGMTVPEIVERITVNPAKALSLDDRAGSLKPGMPADVTVFRVEEGEFALADCNMRSRNADRRIVPTMAFKNGVRFDSDMELCRDERNWFLQIAEDHLPERAARLSSAQARFAGELAAALERTDWEIVTPERLDLEKATELQDIFHEVRRAEALPLKEALEAVFDSFLDHPFTMQIGLFLLRQERPFALERLREVSALGTVAA